MNTATLNRDTKVLEIQFNGQPLTICDQEFGSVTKWDIETSISDVKCSIQLDSNKLIIRQIDSLVGETIIVNEIGKRNNISFVMGVPINKTNDKPKTIDGVFNNKSYRFTPNPNGEFMVNGIPHSGVSLEIEAEYTST